MDLVSTQVTYQWRLRDLVSGSLFSAQHKTLRKETVCSLCQNASNTTRSMEGLHRCQREMISARTVRTFVTARQPTRSDNVDICIRVMACTRYSYNKRRKGSVRRKVCVPSIRHTLINNDLDFLSCRHLSFFLKYSLLVCVSV